MGNVADSHLLADRALRDGRDGVAGQPFFITNGDPRPFWTFLGTFLGSLGYPPKSLPHIHLPFWLIVAIAYIAEVAIALLRALGVNASTEFTGEHRVSGQVGVLWGVGTLGVDTMRPGGGQVLDQRKINICREIQVLRRQSHINTVDRLTKTA